MSFRNMGLRAKIMWGIGVPLVLLVGFGVISIFSVNSLIKTSEWVDHTHLAIQESMNIIGSAVDMETGMRGFLLAGKDGKQLARVGRKRVVQQRAGIGRNAVERGVGGIEFAGQTDRLLHLLFGFVGVAQQEEAERFHADSPRGGHGPVVCFDGDAFAREFGDSRAATFDAEVDQSATGLAHLPQQGFVDLVGPRPRDYAGSVVVQVGADLQRRDLDTGEVLEEVKLVGVTPRRQQGFYLDYFLPAERQLRALGDTLVYTSIFAANLVERQQWKLSGADTMVNVLSARELDDLRVKLLTGRQSHRNHHERYAFVADTLVVAEPARRLRAIRPCLLS